MSEYPFYAVCVNDQAVVAANDRGEVVAAGPGDRHSLLLTVGKTYKILGEKLGMYIVVNNMGTTSLHPKPDFQATADLEPESDFTQ